VGDQVRGRVRCVVDDDDVRLHALLGEDGVDRGLQERSVVPREDDDVDGARCDAGPGRDRAPGLR
jgi:hypothetical protein